MDKKTLTSKVRLTDNDDKVSVSYDYEFDGVIETEVNIINTKELPEQYGIGLIIGKSGSGKSTNLRFFGETVIPRWDNDYSIVSNFIDYDVAQRKLHGCGLNSIKVWRQPRNTLSTGEGYRADIAKTISDNVVYDEFCSFLDPYTSKTLSHSLRKYVDKYNIKNVVLATCRDDIVEWLNPDWVFNCDDGVLTIRGLERRRPNINLQIHPCTVEVWRYFKKYHYLSSDINKGCRCWIAYWDDRLVGFYATIAQPNGNMKNAWRGSRLVVLPEYQGIGIGNALCEYVADIHIRNGKRFFAKTASILLGEHRERSSKWKPTSKNKMKRKDYTFQEDDKKYSQEHLMKHANRFTYSHEYVPIIT